MAEQIRLGCELIQTESYPLLTLPSGGLDKGEVVQINSLGWGFAFSWASDDTENVKFADSVLIITKAPIAIGAKGSGAINQGAKVYWDNSAKVITTTSGGNTYFGRCRTSALSADTEVEFVFDQDLGA